VEYNDDDDDDDGVKSISQNASKLLSNINDMKESMRKLELERRELAIKEQHQIQLDDLHGLIGQKDQQIEDLMSQLESQQSSLKHLLDDLHKRKYQV
jgi:chromosome segregation ATPase